jgi:hypothetical protein
LITAEGFRALKTIRDVSASLNMTFRQRRLEAPNFKGDLAKHQSEGATVKKSFLIYFLVLALFHLGLAVARETREQQRIDFLLNSVETATGIVFIRNGSEYDGAAAAKHLRAKLAYVGERVKTAEQFIQYCASESSMTHRKYTVRLADGTTVDSAVYFTSLLRQWEQQKR